MYMMRLPPGDVVDGNCPVDTAADPANSEAGVFQSGWSGSITVGPVPYLDPAVVCTILRFRWCDTVEDFSESDHHHPPAQTGDWTG